MKSEHVEDDRENHYEFLEVYWVFNKVTRCFHFHISIIQKIPYNFIRQKSKFIF